MQSLPDGLGETALRTALRDNWGYETADERAEVVALLARLHDRTRDVRAGARVAPLQPRGRSYLESALAGCKLAWEGGPFSEPARAAVAANASVIEGLLATFDDRGLKIYLEEGAVPA